jgi:hypothetical protein
MQPEPGGVGESAVGARRPLRLLHLMALVAAVALTTVIPRVLLKVIQQPLSGWGVHEVFAYKISLAMIFWTMLLAVFALIGNRSQIRLASRSYGTAAVLASATGLLVLFVRGVITATVLRYKYGRPFFPYGGPLLPAADAYFCPAARELVVWAPVGAAAGIAAVWLSLALTGTGRRPSDWLDRVCLFFGLLSIVWCLGLDYIRMSMWLPDWLMSLLT